MDSLGKGEFRPSALFPPEHAAPTAAGAAWQYRFAQRSFQLVSVYRKAAPQTALTLKFDPEKSHATLLALVEGGKAQLPAVLHLPEQGSLRIEAKSYAPVRLDYVAHRKGEGTCWLSFPAATQTNPRIVYTLTVAAIYPAIPGIENDPRFDGFRRNFLNIFQVHAEFGVLANHAASDPCAFVPAHLSEVARYAPALADRLTAMDLVRMSLDRYLAGFQAYGIPGYQMFDAKPFTPTSRDSLFSIPPSLLVAASDYVTVTHDTQWLSKNYPGLRKWTEAMLAMDTNGDGLLKYPDSGNSGSWIPRADGG